MNKQSLVALAGGLMLSGAALACTVCEEHAKAQTKAPATAEAVEADGMIAVRDAVTGQLRAPTAEEAAALQAKAQASKSTRARALSATAAPVGRTNAYGATSFRPAPENISYSVVTRNADGTLSTTCVQGQDKAEAMVREHAAKSSNKE